MTLLITDATIARQHSERMDLFKIVIYGLNSQTDGHKFEIYDESDVLVHSGQASSQENARIEANRFVDSWVSDPIETYYRAIPSQ